MESREIRTAVSAWLSRCRSHVSPTAGAHARRSGFSLASTLRALVVTACFSCKTKVSFACCPGVSSFDMILYYQIANAMERVTIQW